MTITMTLIDGPCDSFFNLMTSQEYLVLTTWSQFFSLCGLLTTDYSLVSSILAADFFIFTFFLNFVLHFLVSFLSFFLIFPND